MTGKNEGIIVTGGNVTADQIAVGKGAVARKTVYGSGGAEQLRQIERQLEELRSLLRQHAADLPLAPELAKRADEIASELARRTPDHGRIAAHFDALLSGTKQVVELVSSVASLKDVVFSLLGMG